MLIIDDSWSLLELPLRNRLYAWSANAKRIGVCIALDRDEEISATDARSTASKVDDDLGVLVLPVARLDAFVAHVLKKSKEELQLDQTQAYRTESAVDVTSK